MNRAALRARLREAAGIGEYTDEERSIPSDGQRRLWFLDQLAPGSPAYNVPLAFRLRGRLDLGALTRACTTIADRHEPLRSNFAGVDGVPRVVVRPSLSFQLTVEDHTEGWLARCVAEPFDLAADPLLRVRIARIGPDEHLLCLVLHHIVSDGWSLDVLVRELSTVYSGAELPLPPARFSDYAAWSRRRISGAGVPDHVADAELPADFPRPQVPSSRGDDVVFTVSATTTQRLRELASEQGATLFMVLLAAFTTLLGRYTGKSDVVTGTPMAGRVRREAEDMIGFFVNTVPVRVGVERSFPDLVAACRQATLAAYEHQDVPIDQVAAVRTLVQLDNAPAAFTAGGLDWDPVYVTNGAAKFDVAATFADSGAEITGRLRYATDLFTAATGARMAGHLHLLLDAIAADPHGEAWRVPLWTDEELAVVHAANATVVRTPDHARCLHELAEAQAARTPDAVAVLDENSRLTFAELDRRANQLAWLLRGHGVGVDSVVAVCLHRSTDLVVALLGVLKAGGAYLPLDPDYPPGRLARMVADAAPSVIVTDSGLAGSVAITSKVVLLDRADLAAYPKSAPETGVTPDALAYVIYTSGSTGSPKGVMIHHRAVVNHMLWMGDLLGAGSADVVLQKTPFGFDVSLWELFLPLITGARMVFARPGGHRDPRYLGELIAAQRVTLAHFVPSMLRAFADSGELTGDLPLRALICSGEALPRDLRDRVLAGFGGDLLNLYGPTETTIHSTWSRAATGDGGAVAPIGVPLWNTTAHVLGPDGEPVGFGLPGELFHGGAVVGRGYHGRPGLTAERFVPDPTVPGARLYATGDIVRWRQDGVLEFLGRTDHQVKINGQRIEPGEIESALVAHPLVREAAVLPVADALAAYVTLTGTATPAELRDHLRNHLPAGWLPRHYVVLDRFPLTPSGKLDRKALPAPETAVAGVSTPAGTGTQRELVPIWCDILRLPEAGADDNFFDLGGHSLQITQLVVRVEQATGVRLSVQEAFDAPTIAEQAELVDRRRGGVARTPIPRRTDERPLSYGQQRLWFLDRLQPGGVAYNVQEVLSLPGQVDLAALRAAITELVRRHEVLRTVFDDVSGEPVIRVLPSTPVPLPVTEPTGDQDTAVRAAADAASRRPFDLSEGPLLRAEVLLLGERTVLILSMHHIVIDAWSLDLLVDELTALYHGLRLAEPELRYSDYAAWQREQLSGERLDRELAHWKSALDGAPPVLELPSGLVRPPLPAHRGAIRRFTIDADTADALRGLGRAHNATLFMVLLTAFKVLLARHSGRDDIVVGTPVAGRSSGELESMIGFFVNTVVLRTDLSAATTFADALAAVRRTALAAYEHQDLPFEKLVEELAPDRDLAHQPIYQVMFELHARQPDRGWATVLPIGVANDSAKCDLTLVVTERDGELDCGARYSTDVFLPEDIEVLVGGWLELLNAAVAHPVAQHGIALAGPETAVDTDVAELIRRQCVARPDAIALTVADRHMTFGELENAVAGLAGRLAAAGAGPERLVGVQLPRGADLVVALLAVWRAGAATVALDPGLPARRLAAILDDTRPDLVITTLDLALEGNPAPPVTSCLDGLAYVVHTSGSTGVPKGIAGTHRGLANYLADLRESGLLSDVDTAVAITTVSFDAAMRDTLFPLAVGARVVLVPGGGADIDAVVDALATEQVTVMPAVVPSLLRAITAHAAERRVGFPALRRVLVSGEPLHASDVAGVAAVAPEAAVVNMYGPSETTMTTTRHLVGQPVPPRLRLPVGRPIANAGVHVLDEQLRPVGVGVPGRVYISGAGLARGYHGRPGLTAERFVPHPTEHGERLYDTGDRGRIMPDGTLRYLGRTDHQMKINGVRIDPAEIEAALCEHPAIAEAAVHAHQAVLVACVVTTGNRPVPPAHQMRVDLAELLPASHIPSVYMRLDALPRTLTGKIRRDDLPVPRAEVAQDRAPRGDLEELIAGIWRDVLCRTEVGRDQDFFALGGHSLLAAQVVARVNQALGGTVVPVRALFESPTVAELAVRVDGARAEPVPPLVAGSAIGALSSAQQRLWRLEQRCGQYAFYNVPIIRRVLGPLDPGVLAAALNEMVERHDALRTVFPGGEAELRDIVVALEVADVTDLRAQVADQVRTPFDLAAGPLLRAALLRVGPDEHVLCVVLHHLVADGWSVGVVLRELTTLYAGSPLPEPAVQYADFVAWQQNCQNGRDLEYWTKELDNVGTLFDLPPDYPAVTGPDRPPRARTTLRLSPEIGVLCTRLRATPFMVLMSAFQAVLGDRFDRDDFAVAVPMANRDQAEIDGMIGYVANMVALRADLTGAPTFAALVARTRERALDAHAHRLLPFETVLDALAPDQADSHAPLAQALFNMQDFPHTEVAVPGLRFERTGLNEVWARYPLTLFAHDLPDGVLLDLVYDNQLFDLAWARTFLDAMAAQLESARLESES